MRKMITFHVGLPKTGTSTIQHCLRLHDERLRALGVLYPGPREHQSLQNDRHLVMLSALNGEEHFLNGGMTVEECRAVVRRVFEGFRQSDLKNLIWSCEQLALDVPRWDTGFLKRLLDRDLVRIVFFARYTDDWVESAIRQNIWARVPSGARSEESIKKPLPPLTPPSGATGGADDDSVLGRGMKMIECLRTMRMVLPSADIVVRSFDENRVRGNVVSGALAAMGVPIDGVFSASDEEAGIRNPTKSAIYSMLLYNVLIAQADIDVIRDVGAALKKRERRSAIIPPLAGRHFRFLSERHSIVARSYYDELRRDYPNLPAQRPFVFDPAETRLPKAEGVALLDWLRPEIADTTFERACAAYPSDPRG